MGPEAQVVEKRGLEPVFEVLYGERHVEPVEARGLFECSPEPFEACSRLETIGCREARYGSEPPDGLGEGLACEFAAAIGDGRSVGRQSCVQRHG